MSTLEARIPALTPPRVHGRDLPTPGRGGILLMLASGASSQSGAAIAALGFPALGPVGVVAIRQWVAAVAMLAIARPRLRGWTARQWRAVLALAVVFALINVTLYSAVDRIGLGLAVTLEFLGPLSVALLSSRRVIDVGSAVAAAAGVVVLTRPQPSTDYVGVTLALIAAGCWAGYILVNRSVGARVPGPAGPAVAQAISAALYLPIGIALLVQHAPTVGAVSAAAAAGILCSTVPFLADVAALRRVPARFFGVFMSVNPLFAAVAGWVVLGQAIRWPAWMAIGLIVAANVVTALTSPSSPRSRPRPTEPLVVPPTPLSHPLVPIANAE